MGYQVYWTPADEVSIETFAAFTQVLRKYKEQLLENSCDFQANSDTVQFNQEEDNDMEFHLSRVNNKYSPTECQPNECEWAIDVGCALILALEFGIVTKIDGNQKQFLSDLDTVNSIHPLKKYEEIKAMLKQRLKEEDDEQDSDEEKVEEETKDTFDQNSI